MRSVPRFIAVFPENNQIPQYMADCRLVVTMMTSNKNLLNPMPALPQISSHLDTLEADEELARKKGKGAAQQRDVSLGVLRSDMRLLKAYAQSVADANPTEAEAIIRSAGMGVGKKSTRTKPSVGARQGNAPGRVVLDARALPRPVQYRWQMSTDQTTWTDLPDTFNASTTVDGLTAATVVYFRLRTITRNGPSDWSAVVNLIVH